MVRALPYGTTLPVQAPSPDGLGHSAGIPSADGWADKRLKAAYIELESVQDTMPKLSTERGCLSSALAAIELADEYVAKSQREA